VQTHQPTLNPRPQPSCHHDALPGVPSTSQYATSGALHHTLGNMEDISQEVDCYKVCEGVIRPLIAARISQQGIRRHIHPQAFTLHPTAPPPPPPPHPRQSHHRPSRLSHPLNHP